MELGFSAPRWREALGALHLWRRRNGLLAPRLGLPGIVHQGWGWYDGLGSLGAALAPGAATLFLLATAVYLVAAGVVVTVAREAIGPSGSGGPAVAALSPTPELSPSPSLEPPMPTTTQRAVIQFPTAIPIILIEDTPLPTRAPIATAPPPPTSPPTSTTAPIPTGTPTPRALPLPAGSPTPTAGRPVGPVSATAQAPARLPTGAPPASPPAPLTPAVLASPTRAPAATADLATAPGIEPSATPARATAVPQVPLMPSPAGRSPTGPADSPFRRPASPLLPVATATSQAAATPTP